MGGARHWSFSTRLELGPQPNKISFLPGWWKTKGTPKKKKHIQQKGAATSGVSAKTTESHGFGFRPSVVPTSTSHTCLAESCFEALFWGLQKGQLICAHATCDRCLAAYLMWYQQAEPEACDALRALWFPGPPVERLE